MSDAEAYAEMAQGEADAKALAELMAERGYSLESGYQVIYVFALDRQDLLHKGVFVAGYFFKKGQIDADTHEDVVNVFADVCSDYYSKRAQRLLLKEGAMNILEAMDAMDRGERVRHASFDDRWYCCKVESGYLLNGNLVCTLDMANATNAKLLREGWSIVKESFDFAGAVTRVARGVSVRRAIWPKSKNVDDLHDIITFHDTLATDWEEA